MDEVFGTGRSRREVSVLKGHPYFLQRFVLNLSHTLLGHADDVTNLFERLGQGGLTTLVPADREAFLDDGTLHIAEVGR